MTERAGKGVERKREKKKKTERKREREILFNRQRH